LAPLQNRTLHSSAQPEVCSFLKNSTGQTRIGLKSTAAKKKKTKPKYYARIGICVSAEKLSLCGECGQKKNTETV